MSVHKRPGSSFWQTEFVYKGHRVRRSTGATSRREAEQYERRLREEIREQVANPSPTGQLSLDQACGKFWLEHGHRRRDAKDVQRWLTYILTYIDREMLLAELSARHVNDFVSAMRTADIGDISINRTVTTLQGVHNRAAKVWEEPVRVIGWKPFKTKEHGRQRWITQDQARALLAALPLHIRSLVWFMLLTGIRQREAFDLSWDAVHFDRGVIDIIAKGGIAREVDLSAEAGVILAEQPRDGRFVFDTTNYRRHFDKAKREAGITDFRWHDLRHTCATWLGQAGAPLDVIRQQLGHSSIVVTQKYRHVGRAEVRDALQRIPTISPTSDNVVPLKKAK